MLELIFAAIVLIVDSSTSRVAWWVAVVVVAAISAYFALQAVKSRRRLAMLTSGRERERYDFVRYCFGVLCGAGLILLAVDRWTGNSLRVAVIGLGILYLGALLLVVAMGYSLGRGQARKQRTGPHH